MYNIHKNKTLKNQSGENNPNWKGGIYRHSEGYIMVRCEDHPRAYKYKCYYVFQHILVMEKAIGRYLKPGEVVHHINGIKTDNRIENLELTSQSKHMSYHSKGNMNTRGKHKDTSNRVCFKCGSKTTRIQKVKGQMKTPCPVWGHLPWDKTNWYCHKCYCVLYRLHKRGSAA